MLLDQLGCTPMIEEACMFQHAGTFKLTGAATVDTFLSIICDHEIDVPIWLAWKWAAKRNEFLDIMVRGRKRGERLLFKVGSNEQQEYNPKFIDERFETSSIGNIQLALSRFRTMHMKRSVLFGSDPYLLGLVAKYVYDEGLVTKLYEQLVDDMLF